MELVKINPPKSDHLAIAPVGLHWLAGLLEGEGCFTWCGGSPSIQYQTTDKDVVYRASLLMTAPVKQVRSTCTGKSVWMIAFYGEHAIAWMMTLWAIMGTRRQQRIKELILRWRTRPLRGARYRARDEKGRVLPWS